MTEQFNRNMLNVRDVSDQGRRRLRVESWSNWGSNCPISEQFTNSAIGVKFLATNNYKSVVNTKNGNDQALFSYAPYGHCQAITLNSTLVMLNQRHQPTPRNRLLHFGQEMLATGLLALTGVLEIGTAHLTHAMAGL